MPRLRKETLALYESTEQ